MTRFSAWVWAVGALVLTAAAMAAADATQWLDEPGFLPQGIRLVQAKEPPELPPVRVPGTQEEGPSTQPPTDPPPQPPTPPTPGPLAPGGRFNPTIRGDFQPLPDVEGARINAGKKTENIDLRSQPPIANNNLRQALITVPSLYVSEESTPLVSIGYRGLNPDRAQFMQLLKDGIPIAADMFGYPENYYIPPFQVVDRIEFIHGGSALMYGPQPGGALNFVTKMPVRDRLCQAYAENMYGSFGFFSTYESLSGTADPLGYYFYAHHRQAEGFRWFNSAYEVNYGGGKGVVDLTPDSRLIVGFDLYSEGHGEPGGLTQQAFRLDPYRANRPFDFFQLRRYQADVTYQEAISDTTYFQLKGWGVYYSRFSRRQRGGGFGTAPSGAASATSDFQLQEFHTFGLEPRLRCDYCLFGDANPSTFTIGAMYYYDESPRSDARGPNLANAGTALRNQSQRQTDYLPVFAENLFNVGNWQIVPGIRLENIWQGVQENVNVDKTAAGIPLADEHVPDNVLLLGLGVTYKFSDTVQAYYNIAQSYRPILFAEAVVPGANEIVAGNLQPGTAYQTDLGFRGNPAPWLSWDTSLFYMDFNDQIGRTQLPTGQVLISNVGNAFYSGYEFAGNLDLVGLADAWFGSNYVERIGSFGPFYNATVLQAKFFAGPNTGKTPAYAPPYIQKCGLIYSLRDPAPDNGAAGTSTQAGAYAGPERLRLWFTGTFVGPSFGFDNETPDSFIPSYAVWDLTGETRIYKENVRLFGGIYNIFREQYFARVTSTGIDPAAPRNYFLGLKLLW